MSPPWCASRLLYRLPDNVATREAVAQTNKLLADRKQRDVIVTDWVSFFRDQYQQVANAEAAG